MAENVRRAAAARSRSGGDEEKAAACACLLGVKYFWAVNLMTVRNIWSAKGNVLSDAMKACGFTLPNTH